MPITPYMRQLCLWLLVGVAGTAQALKNANSM